MFLYIFCENYEDKRLRRNLDHYSPIRLIFDAHRESISDESDEIGTIQEGLHCPFGT